MIVDVQTQDIAQASIEDHAALVAVHEQELMHVGGGCVTGSLF